jgi:hypothetical protein
LRETCDVKRVTCDARRGRATWRSPGHQSSAKGYDQVNVDVASAGKSSVNGSCVGSRARQSRAALKCAAGLSPCFLRVWKIVIKMLRVLAPASDCEPKLVFLAMTVGLRSRSARLLSAGIMRSRAQ